MATLTGRYWGSHTYVTSSDGLEWECGGGTYGPINPICSGTGSSSIANCISQGWRSMAGITYGVNGVCHQAANRILYETGQIVWFWAYYTSFPLYGHYGVMGWFTEQAWNDRKRNCGILYLSKHIDPKMKLEENERIHKYLQDLLILSTLTEAERTQKYGASNDPLADTGLLNQELRLWIKYRLGEKVNKEKMEKMIKAQNLLFQNTLTARSNLLNSVDNPQRNAHDINQQLSVCLKNFKDILGAEEYQQAFETDQTDVIVVDPEIVLDAYNDGVYQIAKENMQ